MRSYATSSMGKSLRSLKKRRSLRLLPPVLKIQSNKIYPCQLNHCQLSSKLSTQNLPEIEVIVIALFEELSLQLIQCWVTIIIATSHSITIITKYIWCQHKIIEHGDQASYRKRDYWRRMRRRKPYPNKMNLCFNRL